MIAIRPRRRASWRERADRAPYAAKKGGRNRSCADLAEAAEAAGRAQGCPAGP